MLSCTCDRLTQGKIRDSAADVKKDQLGPAILKIGALMTASRLPDDCLMTA